MVAQNNEGKGQQKEAAREMESVLGHMMDLLDKQQSHINNFIAERVTPL